MIFPPAWLLHHPSEGLSRCAKVLAPCDTAMAPPAVILGRYRAWENDPSGRTELRPSFLNGVFLIRRINPHEFGWRAVWNLHLGFKCAHPCGFLPHRAPDFLSARRGPLQMEFSLPFLLHFPRFSQNPCSALHQGVLQGVLGFHVPVNSDFAIDLVPSIRDSKQFFVHQ